jgi:cell division protease FtsH
VANPDIKGREKILGVHARKTPLGPDVELRLIARGTPGFSGADLANLVNEAALMAARVGRRFVTMIDFENAKDKVMMGTERRSMVLTDDQKEKTAYHEAGHAVVGLSLPKCDPVYKATIIPRGGALGMVVSLPEIDRLNWHRAECEQKLAMTMAGKAAEILKYGEDNVSNGPAGDIQQASGLARAMVMRWGMSDKVGNVDYEQAHEGYMGNGAGGFSISAHTKELIEDEVKRLIDEAYQNARAILEKNREGWERLAQGLLEYETLTGDEIRRVMKGEPPASDDEDGGAPVTEKPSVIAVPRTKPKSSRGDGGGGDGGLEPEPST